MKTPFSLNITNDMGYDVNTNRYYATFTLFMNRTEYKVVAQCEDFDMKSFEPKNFTVEFLDDVYNNMEKIPYNTDLFDEIEIMSYGIFEELKGEEQAPGTICMV